MIHAKTRSRDTTRPPGGGRGLVRRGCGPDAVLPQGRRRGGLSPLLQGHLRPLRRAGAMFTLIVWLGPHASWLGTTGRKARFCSVHFFYVLSRSHPQAETRYTGVGVQTRETFRISNENMSSRANQKQRKNAMFTVLLKVAL